MLKKKLSVLSKLPFKLYCLQERRPPPHLVWIQEVIASNTVNKSVPTQNMHLGFLKIAVTSADNVLVGFPERERE